MTIRAYLRSSNTLGGCNLCLVPLCMQKQATGTPRHFWGTHLMTFAHADAQLRGSQRVEALALWTERTIVKCILSVYVCSGCVTALIDTL